MHTAIERLEPKRTTPFFEHTQIGKGSEIFTITKDPLFSILFDSIDISSIIEQPDLVALTPKKITHPIFLGEESVYRALIDVRTFKRVMRGNDGRLYTIAIKGGDLLNKQQLRSQWPRIGTKEIPGACVIDTAQEEVSNAMILQNFAMAKLGRPTFTIRPISIREIHTVPLSDGNLVDVQTYMNSDNYIGSVTNEQRAWGNIPPNTPFGDLLIDQYRLQPAEYLYAISGLDVRSHELPSLLWFDETDDITLDPLFEMQDGLTQSGSLLGEESKNKIFHAVYARLAEEYQFDLGRLLPKEQMSETDYLLYVQEIPERAESSGIGMQVMQQYIERITEVAALAHSAGYTFSPKEQDIGGSLHPRNVTFGGCVLDLDTLRHVDEDQELIESLKKDYIEMIQSSVCISRLVSMHISFTDAFLPLLQKTYKKNMRRFHPDTTAMERILKKMDIEHIDAITQRMIDFVPIQNFMYLDYDEPAIPKIEQLG